MATGEAGAVFIGLDGNPQMGRAATAWVLARSAAVGPCGTFVRCADWQTGPAVAASVVAVVRLPRFS